MPAGPCPTLSFAERAKDPHHDDRRRKDQQSLPPQPNVSELHDTHVRRGDRPHESNTPHLPDKDLKDKRQPGSRHEPCQDIAPRRPKYETLGQQTKQGNDWKRRQHGREEGYPPNA